MTKTLRRTCQWLAPLSALLIAIAALGQSPGSQVGREVAIPVHLQDGEEFIIPIPHLIQYGAQLFNAKFTAQEGAGRPKSKGTCGEPRSAKFFDQEAGALLGSKFRALSQTSPKEKGALAMNSSKYVGMDVHTATISVAVRSTGGKLIMESVLETKASTLLQFIRGLGGDVYVTFEEGTWAAWLYDLLKPYVTKIVVCDPRHTALLKEGSKSDRIDARKLSELLRANLLRPVYHGEKGLRTLKELTRAYLTISKDLTRVMNRVKAIYRSWGIPCGGKSVYNPRHRDEWLSKITQASVRRRAELYYQQLDALVVLRKQARQELLVEGKKHKAWKLLRSIPALGPIRTAVLMAILQTPHRFRTKRPLWKYSGFGLVTHTSADHRYVNGQLERSKKPVSVRGLDSSHNHYLKDLFKSAAIQASTSQGPFRDFYEGLVAKGMRIEMARLTLARKIAAITLAVWKKGVAFDAKYLKHKQLECL